MVLDFSKATNQQLLIIVSEDCPISYKYKAACELHARKDKAKSRKVSQYKNKATFSDKSYHFYS